MMSRVRDSAGTRTRKAIVCRGSNPAAPVPTSRATATRRSRRRGRSPAFESSRPPRCFHSETAVRGTRSSRKNSAISGRRIRWHARRARAGCSSPHAERARQADALNHDRAEPVPLGAIALVRRHRLVIPGLGSCGDWLPQETHPSGLRGHRPSRIQLSAGHRPEWGLPRYAIIALRAVSSATCGVGPYAWQMVWMPVR